MGKSKPAARPDAKEQDERIRERHSGMLWTRLVSDGAVVVRRANALKGAAAALAALSAGLLVFDALRHGGAPSAPKPPVGYEIDAAGMASWRQGMALRSVTAEIAAAATPAANYDAFAGQLESNPALLAPQSQAKPGQVPCAPMKSLAETWLNPASGLPDQPRCKFSEDGEHIWIATFVKAQSGGQELIYPVSGVLRKEGFGWAYYNFDATGAGGLHEVRGKKTVDVTMIPGQVSKDFPEALKASDYAEKGVVGKARAWWNKNK